MKRLAAILSICFFVFSMIVLTTNRARASEQSIANEQAENTEAAEVEHDASVGEAEAVDPFSYTDDTSVDEGENKPAQDSESSADYEW